MVIKRRDIKHNFLRRIILRLDYDGIVDIKDTLKNIEDKLPSYGFVEMTAEFINEAEFELDDPNMIESQLSIPLKDLHKIETFKYRNENKNIILEINKLYTSLTINIDKYMEFERYCNIFAGVIDSIKKQNIYINPTRLGLRKINDCIIKDKSKFENYFNSEYFSDITMKLSQDGFNSEKINTQFVDTIMHDEFMFNYARIASSGVLSVNGSEYDVYQVVIDIDGYTHDNIKLKSIINNGDELKSQLIKVNGNLFDLYIRTLNCRFAEELTHTNFTRDDILGVSKNDRI